MPPPTFPTADHLADHPGLVPWLISEEWREKLDRPIQGEIPAATFASIKLYDAPEPDSAGEVVVEALIPQPTGKPRASFIYLYFNYDAKRRRMAVAMQQECRCRDRNCTHTAAILATLKAIAEGKPAAAPPADIAISPTTAAWLRKIREATAPKTSPTKTLPSKFLAYCIERYRKIDDPDEHLNLVLRTGKPTKLGFSIEATSSTFSNHRPPSYLTNEDHLLLRRINDCTKHYGHPHDATKLDGDQWPEILKTILPTGRLFFGFADPPHSSKRTYTRLAAGPPLHAEPAWQLHDDATVRPILKLPSESLLLIPTDPPLYLDPDQQTLGALESHIPTPLLKAWLDGPEIQADELEGLGRELTAILPENPLPVPAAKPAQRITNASPTPRLLITEVHVGVFQKRHIGGIVTFSYPGRPPFFPLTPGDPTQVSWMDGDTRVVLFRNREEEQQLLETLATHDLLPISNFYHDRDLSAKNRWSVVVGSPKNTATDWLEFLASPAAEALRQSSWTLETDPKLGLTIHDATDFFPSLESERDGDHGIDWFRFDVTGEFDGKRVSFIPQIARAIAEDWHLRYQDPESRPATLLIPCDNPADGHIRFPANRFLELLDRVRHLFHGLPKLDGPLRLDRLNAAQIADSLTVDATSTARTLATLGESLRNIHGLPDTPPPPTLNAALRPYQLDGFRWLQFLAHHGLHGILADDMGLGKTLQTLAHLAALHQKSPGKPSLVIAPTSVVPNWAAEARKFTPSLKVLVLHGPDRAVNFPNIPHADIVITSYPLLVRDLPDLLKQPWHALVLDEAQYIKNPRAQSTLAACQLHADHRVCLSGTPMENHLGELWSLMRFLMPGFLGDEKSFNTHLRKSIERDHCPKAQLALNRRVAPLILRRTKDQVATELPEKTTLIHGIDLNPAQADLYESVRAAMDDRVRDAIAAKGLASSHIIVLDALLKLRQICCHPSLLRTPDGEKSISIPSAKLDFLTKELLPPLLEEGRRILLFSQFTSMLERIEARLIKAKIPHLKLTGQTTDRASLVERFQTGEIPIFLISLKAGGTGLNLTAADTVIHYDPWWNPSAENQATDRAHRIGQTKPVFVHKLICRGTIEDRILELQGKKAALVEALLSEETTSLKLDEQTLSHLFAPVM
jgi:superfamily II DNA or RNA helicase